MRIRNLPEATFLKLQLDLVQSVASLSGLAGSRKGGGLGGGISDSGGDAVAPPLGAGERAEPVGIREASRGAGFLVLV